MATRNELFTTLLGILEPDGITSSISFYTDQEARDADYKHLLKVAFERTEAGTPERAAFVDALNDSGFWADSDDLEKWKNEFSSTDVGAINDLLNVATERLSVIGTAAQIDPNTGEIGDLPGDDVIKPAGATGEFPGVMAGGTIHRVDNPAGQEDYFIVKYTYQGNTFYYRMGSAVDVERAIGPNMGGGSTPIGETIPEGQLGSWVDGGDSNEIQGVGGTFAGHMDDISREAGIAAGIDDPSLVGAALADPDIALIMAKAATGDWTKLQVKAALRGTDYYKDVLYPGIEHFYGSSQNPEAVYAQYKQNVEASLKSLGIAQDPQGGYASQLTSLLDKGVTDTAFATFAKIYQQAQSSVGFAGSLSKWTERFTGTSIGTFEDYYDVLAGNAPADILEIAEMAGLQFIADNAGFSISDQDIENIAEATNLTQEGAAQLFSNTARRLLALGERGLRKGGLSSTAILEAEAGFGGSVESTKLLMNKLAQEEGISDDPTASIFTDFNREGAPIKKGLGANIAEGA